ncbi:hypothetical protein DEU56DRAFT_919634 [Suillus clintonianus]|uniref:uncharacterized protein n=1 Tax=Suillus clintonianus TaxID=1904413 RepID=UPI001B86BF08|nr:uncharacterized protein DEU56DRAFT_919634 [Suillus clintonianus]KAG2114135.1 hypothetical protein DEU56DRAFT_919634 [Suillus clintonianus]
MSTRRVTCAKNATQHPGIPDITPKKKRRTAEEVAAERQSKLDAKEEKERTKRASIKCVAKYEKNQADQDVVTDATPRAALPKPKPIPSKRKAVVAPPATKKKVTPPSDAEMSDARAAPSVPRPRPKPIPRKQKVIVQTPAAEDNGFLSDAEMDDAAADSSAFNPDPTQHSGTTPAWADDSDDVEELKAAPDDHDDPKSPNDNNFMVLDNNNNNNNNNNNGRYGHSEEPKLQDPSCHSASDTGSEGSYDLPRTCGVTPIYDRIKTNNSYASALATLVDARVPLFRTELKDDACAQVTAYYRLRPDCVDTTKALLANHVYHYAQHFDDTNDPIPQPTKPYSADILPYLMKGRYFNGSKSVGVKFANHFKEIAGNKAQRPEVMIPMVALTSTSVYAALLWKSSKSPSKFNFTGNQFSEVYIFHVNFLNEMEENAPSKFHKLMADIFEAVQKLCSNGATAIASHKDAMAFLDLDGMDDDDDK